MANKAVYDQEDVDKDFFDQVDGAIPKDEQKAMEQRATDGLADNNARENGQDPDSFLQSKASSKQGDSDDSNDSFARDLDLPDNERQKFEQAGFLVNKASNKTKRSFIGKGGARKKMAYVVGGGVFAVAGSILGFIFSILPFELQHIKNVFETEIGGVRDTVITTRRGMIYSRMFFINNDVEGNPRFDGYKNTGVMARLTGKNIRSDRIVSELRDAGFEFVPETTASGKLTGRFEAITFNGERIDNSPSAFRGNPARQAFKNFFDEKYSGPAAFWRSRLSRQLVYDRFQLNRFRSNWLQAESVKAVDSFRLKFRQALFSGDVGQPRVTGSVIDGQDEEGRPIQADVGDDISADAGDRLQAVKEGADGRSWRASFRGVASGAVKTIGTGAALRTISAFGVAATACEFRRQSTIVEVGSRTLKQDQLVKASTLFMSAADTQISGEGNAVDYGLISEQLATENPETGNNFYGSGGWQWISGDRDAQVNSDIRDRYSADGGFTGSLASINDAVSNSITDGACQVATNPIVQGVGIGLAVLSVGSLTVANASLNVGLEVALAVASAVFIPMIIDLVAGTIVDGDHWGDEWMSILGAGFISSNNLMASAHALRPVTNAEMAMLTQETERRLAAEQSNMSFTERYLSMSNHRSITANIATRIPRSAKAITHSVSSFLSNPLSIVKNSFGFINNNRAYAAAQGSTQCTDEDIVNANLAASPWCNVLYGEDVQTLAIDPAENFVWLLDNGYIDEAGTPQGAYEAYADRCFAVIDPIHDNSNEFSSKFDSTCFEDKTVAEADGSIRILNDEEIAARQRNLYTFNDLDVALGITPEDEGSNSVYAQGATAGNIITLEQRFRTAHRDLMIIDSTEEAVNNEFDVRVESGLSDDAEVVFVDGDAQQLAQELLSRVDAAETNIRFGATESCSSACVRDSFEQAARGEPSSVTGDNTTVREVPMSAGMLRVLLAISDAGHRIQISSATTGTHGATSNHYKGTAVDLSSNYTDLDAVAKFLYDNRLDLKINELIHNSMPSGTTTLKRGEDASYSQGVLEAHRHIHYSVLE